MGDIAPPTNKRCGKEIPERNIEGVVEYLCQSYRPSLEKFCGIKWAY